MPTTLKSRLIIVFGTLLIGVLSLISIVVFDEMKNLILTKHIESAHSVASMGTIPLTDAMLSKSLGNPLPFGYLDNALKKLRNESSQKIYYSKFINLSGTEITASNNDPVWYEDQHKYFSDQTIFKSDDRWVLEVVEKVSISTKVWGYLVLGFDAGPIRNEVQRILFFIYAAVGGAILITLFAVNLIAETLTKRLNILSSAVDEFDTYIIGKNLPDGDDEIGKLASNFNDLRKRLIQSRQELKDSERNVFHAEKLVAIGRLAAGVAHEINNPLTGIRHSINNILNDKEGTLDKDEYLSLIDEALEKIESVVSKLLGFSRRKGDKSTDTSINDAIITITKLLDYSIQSKKIELKMDLDSDIPSIHCNPHLIDEICMNLIINALDACESGCKIMCRSYSDNQHVVLEIDDNGHGIQSKNIQRIFEPFFTTKEVGKGTGLGLYVTREIVNGLGGEIDLTTQVDSGTKFIVKLPVS
ncbi:MAG: hypothetical protein H8E70_05755 [Candidatus Marinimicrobia bacterium]|nr:hypothetical protein [Candidatus Neomarinimicrobiota bacterium]